MRWLSGDGQVLNVTVFEAAIAPMIGGAIVAIDQRTRPAPSNPDGRSRDTAFVPDVAGFWWRLLGPLWSPAAGKMSQMDQLTLVRRSNRFTTNLQVSPTQPYTTTDVQRYPLDVDSRRHSNVSNAQLAAIR